MSKHSLRVNSLRYVLLCAGCLALNVAYAHIVVGSMTGGFTAGFWHPITGYSHLLAMVSVGIWGAFLGAPAIWVLPVAFPLVMAGGGMMGIAGVPIPGTAIGTALSVIALGAVIAYAARPHLAWAVLLVSIFAIFHGYVHGRALPNDASPFAFAIGFVLATGMLHVTGIIFGLLAHLPYGKASLRSGGALIALAGCYLTFAVTTGLPTGW